MSNRRANPVDRLIRLFREVSGDVPDGASLARMHRVSSALNLHDNDALWSIIAVLEYYVRMYETMPERIRWASEGSLEAARREVGGAIDALMQQHRDALERCKGTIQLAEKLIQEHEERYQAALAQLNDERMSTQVARTAGNRLIGVAAVAAREQRDRLDSAVSAFGQAIEAATERVEAMATRMERRFARSMNRLLLVGVAVLCLLLTTGLVSWSRGYHWVGADCRAGAVPAGRRQALKGPPSALPGYHGKGRAYASCRSACAILSLAAVGKGHWGTLLRVTGDASALRGVLLMCSLHLLTSASASAISSSCVSPSPFPASAPSSSTWIFHEGAAGISRSVRISGSHAAFASRSSAAAAASVFFILPRSAAIFGDTAGATTSAMRALLT